MKSRDEAGNEDRTKTLAHEFESSGHQIDPVARVSPEALIGPPIPPFDSRRRPFERADRNHKGDFQNFFSEEGSGQTKCAHFQSRDFDVFDPFARNRLVGDSEIDLLQKQRLLQATGNQFVDFDFMLRQVFVHEFTREVGSEYFKGSDAEQVGRDRLCFSEEAVQFAEEGDTPVVETSSGIGDHNPSPMGQEQWDAGLELEGPHGFGEATMRNRKEFRSFAEVAGLHYGTELPQSIGFHKEPIMSEYSI